MDPMQLMLLQQMMGDGGGIMGGGAPAGPKPVVSEDNRMRTLSGLAPDAGLLGAPLDGSPNLIEASAYRDFGDWGNAKPDSALTKDPNSLFGIAHRVKNPTMGDKVARGWKGFGNMLDGMSPMMRMTMASQGLGNLGRVLSGRM